MQRSNKIFRVILLAVFTVSLASCFGQDSLKTAWNFESNRKSGFVYELEDYSHIEDDSTFLIFETQLEFKGSSEIESRFQFWTFMEDSSKTFQIDLIFKSNTEYELYATLLEDGTPVIFPPETVHFLYRKKASNEFLLDWTFICALDPLFSKPCNKRYLFRMRLSE